MAIKGKKKSRGSQGAKRPAGAPRPVIVPGGSKTHWYKTRDGLMVLGIFAVVAIGVVIWLVGSARNRAQDADQVRDAIQSYSDAADDLIGDASTTIEAMAAVQAPPTGKDLKDLQSDVGEWQQKLQESQIALTQLGPPREVTGINQLFNEALALYGSSADTFSLFAQDPSSPQAQQIFNTASNQRDTASAVMQSAITTLDQIRVDHDMGPSGISAPVLTPGGQAPETEVSPGTSEVTIPPAGGDSDKKGKKNGGD